MSEHDVIAGTHEPITVMTLVTHLAACGLGAGQTVLVHTRLSALGWVVGGAQADSGSAPGNRPDSYRDDADSDVEESRSIEWRARARARSVVAHDSSPLACV